MGKTKVELTNHRHALEIALLDYTRKRVSSLRVARHIGNASF